MSLDYPNFTNFQNAHRRTHYRARSLQQHHQPHISARRLSIPQVLQWAAGGQLHGQRRHQATQLRQQHTVLQRPDHTAPIRQPVLQEPEEEPGSIHVGWVALQRPTHGQTGGTLCQQPGCIFQAIWCVIAKDGQDRCSHRDTRTDPQAMLGSKFTQRGSCSRPHIPQLHWQHRQLIPTKYVKKNRKPKIVNAVSTKMPTGQLPSQDP